MVPPFIEGANIACRICQEFTWKGSFVDNGVQFLIWQVIRKCIDLDEVEWSSSGDAAICCNMLPCWLIEDHYNRNKKVKHGLSDPWAKRPKFLPSRIQKCRRSLPGSQNILWNGLFECLEASLFMFISVVVPGLSPKSDFGRFNLSPMDLQSEWWIHTIWLRCSSLSAHSAPNCDWGANIHFSFNSRILRVAWRERIRQHPSGKNTPTSPMPFITCVTEKLSDPTKNGEIWIVSNHLKNLWFKSFKSVKSPSCLLKDHHKYSINWLKRPQPSHSRAVRTKRKALKSFTTSPSPGPQLSGSWLGFPFPFWKQSKL